MNTDFESLMRLTCALSRMPERDRRNLGIMIGLDLATLDQAISVLKVLVIQYENYH